MGTLAKPNAKNTRNKNTKRQRDQFIDLTEDETSSKDRQKIEKKLNKEYARIRTQFEDVRQAFTYAEDARPHEDIYYRLLQLEKASKRVRRGGIFGRGAKLHRRLLRSLNKTAIR